MAIEFPDSLHALASLAFVSPNTVRFIQQDGFLSAVRVDEGVYAVTLNQPIAKTASSIFVNGRDGWGCIATVVHTSNAVKTIYLFGVDGNPRDASIDIVVYRQAHLVEDPDAGADLSPPSAGTGGGGGGPPTGPAGGDLGGTYPDPTVVALETTDGGGTRLAIGDINDGEMFVRVGATVVGAPIPNSSDDITNDSDVPGATVTDALNDLQDALVTTFPSSTVIGPYSTSDFYDTGDNPLTGEEDFSLVILYYAGPWATGDQFLFGTYDLDTAGGVGLWFNETQIVSRCRDGAGNVNQMTLTPPTMRQFGHVIHLTMAFDGDDGAGQTDTFLYANGARTNTTHTGGSGPMSDPGNNLRVGMRFGGTPDAGASSLYIIGMAYFLGVMTPTQVDAHYQACMEQNRFANLPGSSFARGWRSQDGGGAVWTPFTGVGAMNETGNVGVAARETRAWF